jgi:BolA protein
MSMQQRIESALALLQHSRGVESHYKAVVVSEQFEGLSRLKRHQHVYGTLGELMGEFHALALHTYTAQEWQASNAVPASPTCAGGDGGH